MVARPLWERKAVGSNPATPTTDRPSPAVADLWAVTSLDRLWGVSSLPLLCKLHARMPHPLVGPPGGESAGAGLAPAETKKSAPKETEP